MRKQMQLGVLAAALACVCVATGSAQSRRQDAPQSNSSAPKQIPPPQNAPQASQPAGANDNAFPEAQSEAAQKKAQDQASKGSDNAFPEAQSEAAEKAAGGGDGSAAAPSDKEPYSSSTTRSKGLDLLGNNESPISDGAGHFVNNPTLAKEDIRVGKLYLAQQDYAGAYMRLKEATEVDPGSAEAVYLLGEAARKTSHLDEAESNFKLYLDADPRGRYAKDARKALAELSGK